MVAAIAALNQSCACVELDECELERQLAADLGSVDLIRGLLDERPHLFAELPIFVAPAERAQMSEVVAAVERVAALPAFEDSVLGWAPAIARRRVAQRGVLYSYDFHLGADGPQLIEINSNAGGALLGLYAERAQRGTADAGDLCGRTAARDHSLEQALVSMFHDEWRLAWGARCRSGTPGDVPPLRTIAIVDEEPERQFLHPEMLLFARLFERNGITAVVVDPAGLELHNGALHANGLEIDMVYNRLTDFYFEDRSSSVLREAYLSGAAVVTPHPRGHALYASKRNLTLLSHAESLRDLGIDEPTVSTLTGGVPRTTLADPDRAEELWAARRSLFFKPVAGYGSRGAYRGAKLTRRVWQSILDADYVAQELVAPSERRALAADSDRPLKVDLRCFVYDGRVLSMGGRLYRGQTTNMRTAGGGLSVVLAPGA
jgi:hypothetical protein